MYYRKYFEGTVEAGTATSIKLILRNKQGASTTALSTCNPKRNKVIGDAIVSTLKDCGLDAYYDEECSYIYFDKNNSDFGIYISCENGYTRLYAGFYSSKYTDNAIHIATTNNLYSTANNNANYIPFYNTSYLLESDYKFYVQVRGDTAGMFTLYIGSYNTPTAMNVLYATFYRGTDKRNDRDLWGFYMQSNPVSNIFWVYADTLIGVIDTSTSSPYPPVVQYSVSQKLTMQNEWVVLIEMYAMCGFIVINNTYLDPGFGTNASFYEVNNEVYFCYTPYFTKCVTVVEGDK